MSQSITIPRGERGAIRVFAINRNPVEMEVALSRQPKPDLARELLDAPHLNTLGTEIFPIKDLEGVGLAGYLSEGYAVPDEQLSADRSKLGEYLDAVRALEKRLEQTERDEEEARRSVPEVPAGALAGKLSAWDIDVILISSGEEDGVTEVPLAVPFAGGTFNAPDNRIYQEFTATVAIRNRLP